MGQQRTASAIRHSLRRYVLALELTEARHGGAWGLSTSETFAVRLIGHADGLTPSQLGSRLRLSSGGTTALVQRLEGRGWIARAPHATDGRSVVLRLTSHGRERSDARASVDAGVDELTNELPPAERAVVRRWLDRIAHMAERHAEETPPRHKDAGTTRQHLGPPSLWS